MKPLLLLAALASALIAAAASLYAMRREPEYPMVRWDEPGDGWEMFV